MREIVSFVSTPPPSDQCALRAKIPSPIRAPNRTTRPGDEKFNFFQVAARLLCQEIETVCEY